MTNQHLVYLEVQSTRESQYPTQPGWAAMRLDRSSSGRLPPAAVEYAGQCMKRESTLKVSIRSQPSGILGTQQKIMKNDLRGQRKQKTPRYHGPESTKQSSHGLIETHGFLQASATDPLYICYSISLVFWQTPHFFACLSDCFSSDDLCHSVSI